MPVSELCDKLGLQPTVFYRRQKEFFEKTEISAGRFVAWLDVAASKFYD